ncbi:glycoside hydrolase family 3 C-terminal domain-containing protein [Streptantibioticus rubrisoli]|uniref:Glycoside hydrolase family 3 C-terminal domain-containing protein n=1 Tax=Streptantibioticus rubrisoli TaxID=1387313 RepID=A0ABT1PDG6_9ACTN|nr:glycoside hydrolase family 3 C-terminal domain-containing protein [Streptantibioticus rubrisoli]MCQ4043401.1 glycoside hydrolase family 3 C-terminal domain-containing protein [Streptantibioticus rubrisoli]
MGTRLLVLFAVCTLLTGGVAAADQRVQPDQQLNPLVGKMTLDEKLSFVHWTVTFSGPFSVGYLPGVPRLGIPEIRAADGPAGIRLNNGTAAALPAPVALAASFDDQLAKSYGSAIGRDGRALGQDLVMGPMMNTIRVPQAGRNYETFSEDPLVSARTAAAEIQGIQSQGLMATAKHFAENNQEDNRQTVDVNVDEQALHEIELPAFKSAAHAGVSSVMCAYNKVNGTPSCGNAELLDDILRTQWDFKGWVMSDWMATHSTDAITKGLDQELGIDWTDSVNGSVPGGKYFGEPLKKAVEDGRIPMATLDTAVSRIVTQLQRFGLVGAHPPARPARDPAGAAKVAQRVAEDGAVLLRDKDGALPLTGTAGRSIAVIGPTAKDPKVSGLGSAHVEPDTAVAPLDTIRARAGAEGSVTYSTGEELVGSALPADALSPAFAGGTVLKPGTVGSIYDGTLTVPEDGDYRLAVRVTGGAATVQVDGGAPIQAGEAYGKVTSAPMRLTAGAHKLSISGQTTGTKPLTLDLSWVTPQAAEAAIDQAVASAKAARTAIVFAYDDGAEGADRTSLALPGHQEELISRVAKANPNTVVVLNTGSAVKMPWLDDTAAVLDMWYPGESGAQATAALLFGDVNPSGKLTQTFPVDEHSTPVTGDPKRYPGVGDEETYSEGIYVGYRWYDKNEVRPLFPFGYGLTYTSFDYRDVSAVPAGDGYDISFTLRNTGQRAGKEVAQVYLGASPEVRAPQADRALAGYAKVELAPGQSERVTVHIDGQKLKYWNTASHGWATGAGVRSVFVGPSSAILPLQAKIAVPAA